MSIVWKVLLWAFLTAFVVAGAQAHELTEGTGVVCDTVEQIERFASLDATHEAIKTVNAGQNVCVMATVSYYRGRDLNRVRSSEHSWQVVEILVVAFVVRGQWATITPPSIQYTLFQVEEQGA